MSSADHRPFLAIAAASLLATGCHPHRNDTAPGDRDADGHCVAPLTDYCAPADCPTLDEARACATDTGSRYEERQCGSLIVIGCYSDYGGPTYYFDETGTLVTVVAQTDSPYYCESVHDSGSTEIRYGESPPENCW